MKKIVTIIFSLLFCASAYAGRDKVFDLSGRGPQIFSYERVPDTGVVRLTSHIPKILGVSSSNVLAEWYAGYTSAGDLLDISGNSRDLADTASPSIVDSDILAHNGTGLKAFSYDGATQYHSRAHASWQNIFDDNFTLVILLKSSASSNVFAHSNANNDGIVITNANTMTLYNSGLAPTSKAVSSTSISTDSYYHLCHYVRNNNIATVYIDGVAGTPVDVTGYGTDGTPPGLYLGSGTGSYFSGTISYTRLQNTALTYSQVQKEVALFQGVLASRSAGRYLVPTFLRETSGTSTGVVYTPRSTGSVPLAKMPAGWPRTTADQGIYFQGSATQLLTYTGAFSTNWNKVRSSITATSIVLPDGTTGTTNALHEDGTAGSSHYIWQAVSVSAGSTYCLSVYVKYNGSAAVPREWLGIQIYDGSTYTYGMFNIRTGGTGTVSPAGAARIQAIGNGWYRLSVFASSVGSANLTVYFVSQEANMDATFDGQNQDSVFIAFPQLETGTFPTSYIPRLTDTAASRTSDFLTFIPWKINKDLQSKVSATPRLLFNGSESLNAATVTPTTGSYTFTKNGRPQNVQTESEGNHFRFNGTTDYLSLANGSGGSDFNPSGDFSVVAVVTPRQNSGNYYITGKWTAAGDQRGWLLYQTNTYYSFAMSTDGTAGTVLSASSGSTIQIGKPTLITATYSTTNGLVIRVDALTAGTQAATGVIYNGNTDFTVGYASSNYFLGNMHYLAYYNNYVVTEAEHNAMYAAFKQDGILPLTMSSSTPKKKMIIELDAKHPFSSISDSGAITRWLLSISGAYGTASATRNNISLYVRNDTAASWARVITDNSSTERYIYSAARTDHNRWTTHKWVINCSDLGASTYSLNGVNQTNTASMTGTASFDFRDTLIRLGAGYSGTVDSFVEVRNVKIWVE